MAFSCCYQWYRFPHFAQRHGTAPIELPLPFFPEAVWTAYVGVNDHLDLAGYAFVPQGEAVVAQWFVALRR